MLLRDLILEDTSDAATAAKSQGLDNLGFGRWGKDGKVTHITQNGKLVPYTSPDASSTNNTQKSQQTSTDQSTDQKSPTTDKSNTDSTTKGIGRARTYKVAGLSDVASNVSNTLGENLRVTDLNETLSAVTKHFGRDSAPSVQRGGPGIDFLNQHYGDEDTSAVYDFDKDVIELGKNTVDIPDTPVSEWDDNQINSFKTHVHETIHSTSPRLKPGSTWMNSGLNLSIEEGLTEYIAQGIVDTTIRPHNSKVENTNSGEGYRGFVDGIELMAKYGGLNVDTTFRNPNTNGVRNAVRDAETTMVVSTLKRAGITSDNPLTDKLLSLSRNYLNNDSMMLFDEKISSVFFDINKEFDEGKSLSAEEVGRRLQEILPK